MRKKKLNSIKLTLDKITVTKIENLTSVKGGDKTTSGDEWTIPPTDDKK